MSDVLPPLPPGPMPPPLPADPSRVPSQTPVTAMVLGILSIVLAGLPVVGLVLGIIGLQKSKVAQEEIRTGAAAASASGMATAGRVCSIIGTCLASVYTLVMCLWLSCFGSMMLSGVGAAARNAQRGGSSSYPGR